jgi:hypothetical protein
MKISNYFVISLLSLFVVSCSNSSKELIIHPDGENVEDAVVCKYLPYQNFSEEENIHLYTAKQGDSINVNRVVLNFKEIPKDVKIDSAFLQLKFNKTSVIGKENFGENQFVVRRIISPWSEQDVNWASMPKTSLQNEVYADKVRLSNDPQRVNVTRLVQDISDDRDNSYGFMLNLVNENQNALLLLASSNHPNKELRPSLSVFYSKK